MIDDFQELDEPSPEEEAEARSRAAAGSAIPWIEGIRGMVRDRQYEITLMMDAAPAKAFPIENAAWQRVKHELEAVADLCNRMVTRASRSNSQNVRTLATADGNQSNETKHNDT